MKRFLFGRGFTSEDRKVLASFEDIDDMVSKNDIRRRYEL